MREHIGPLDQLPNGTKVRVGSKRGTVVSSEYVPAIPSGMIFIHTIKLTEKRVKVRQGMWHWEPIKPTLNRIGYCSIFVEETN